MITDSFIKLHIILHVKNKTLEQTFLSWRTELPFIDWKGGQNNRNNNSITHYSLKNDLLNKNLSNIFN